MSGVSSRSKIHFHARRFESTQFLWRIALPFLAILYITCVCVHMCVCEVCSTQLRSNTSTWRYKEEEREKKRNREAGAKSSHCRSFLPYSIICERVRDRDIIQLSSVQSKSGGGEQGFQIKAKKRPFCTQKYSGMHSFLLACSVGRKETHRFSMLFTEIHWKESTTIFLTVDAPQEKQSTEK